MMLVIYMYIYVYKEEVYIFLSHRIFTKSIVVRPSTEYIR